MRASPGDRVTLELVKKVPLTSFCVTALPPPHEPIFFGWFNKPRRPRTSPSVSWNFYAQFLRPDTPFT
jgi:hypothetical protein